MPEIGDLDRLLPPVRIADVEPPLVFVRRRPPQEGLAVRIGVGHGHFDFNGVGPLVFALPPNRTRLDRERIRPALQSTEGRQDLQPPDPQDAAGFGFAQRLLQRRFRRPGGIDLVSRRRTGPRHPRKANEEGPSGSHPSVLYEARERVCPGRIQETFSALRIHSWGAARGGRFPFHPSREEQKWSDARAGEANPSGSGRGTRNTTAAWSRQARIASSPASVSRIEGARAPA